MGRPRWVSRLRAGADAFASGDCRGPVQLRPDAISG